MSGPAAPAGRSTRSNGLFARLVPEPSGKKSSSTTIIISGVRFRCASRFAAERVRKINEAAAAAAWRVKISTLREITDWINSGDKTSPEEILAFLQWWSVKLERRLR